MGNMPVVKKYDKKTHKRCTKCKKWKPKEDILDEETGEVLEKHGFGQHDGNADGLQVICMACKGKRDSHRRNMNSTARLRHHIATRCMTQLGELCPKEFTRNLEDYLGYRITALVKWLREDLKEREGPDRKLRDALEEGYHVDHKRPLSSYPVVVPVDLVQQPGEYKVDWAMFRECWDIYNLTAIPAAENLAKGAKWDAEDKGDAGD